MPTGMGRGFGTPDYERVNSTVNKYAGGDPERDVRMRAFATQAKSGGPGYDPSEGYKSGLASVGGTGAQANSGDMAMLRAHAARANAGGMMANYGSAANASSMLTDRRMRRLALQDSMRQRELEKENQELDRRMRMAKAAMGPFYQVAGMGMGGVPGALLEGVGNGIGQM